MRRGREYVELQLSENIDLATLAAVAGLSMHHLAQEFKQSAGVTPHHSLTKKRVERAQKMLAEMDLDYLKLRTPPVIWRVIFVTWSVLRLGSFGGRNAGL
jgi:AraC-like DNA-binding protein